MKIIPASDNDKEFAMSINKHFNDSSFDKLVYAGAVYILREENVRVGLMSYCVLWDSFPFLNFLFVREEYRSRGYASQAIAYWENEMKNQGYKMVLISTQADEGAQHLYRRLGYTDCGGLLFNNTPFDQPMEIFFRKVL